MLSTLTGTVKLENYEVGDHSEGRRQRPFNCSDAIEPYKCKTSPSFRTNFLVSLKHHQRNGRRNAGSDKDIYKCLKCFFVTHSKYFLVRHCNASGCVTRNVDERKTRFMQYRIDRSNLKLTNLVHEYHFDSEIKEKISIKSHECAQCDSKFARQATLARHMELCHPKPTDNLFTCLHCALKFKRKSQLNFHIGNRHTKRELLECDQCSYKTKRKRNFNAHMWYCHGILKDIKWFECDQCPYKCQGKGKLNTHIQECHKRSKDTPWLKCDQCSYRCKGKKKLNTHVQRHNKTSDDTPWLTCNHCPYKCKQEAALNKHFERRHTSPDVDSFECDQYIFRTQATRRYSEAYQAMSPYA